MSDQEIVAPIQNLATGVHVVPASDVEAPALGKRDPDELLIVATGKAGYADYIVTRDEHLCSLDSVEGMKVVYPEEFLKIVLKFGY